MRAVLKINDSTSYRSKKIVLHLSGVLLAIMLMSWWSVPKSDPSSSSHPNAEQDREVPDHDEDTAAEGSSFEDVRTDT